MHVVATAGHVDHGKSTLVRALTGMEPDRLAEERRRGLTLDLGFAWTTLAGAGAAGLADPEVAFVDVPGHERFVPTMLAGVGPVPVVLLVVAADGGWMPQSSEHADALAALGVDRGLLVVTRADLADAERVRAVVADARAHLTGTSLAGLEAVAVSASTGAGLDALRTSLAGVLAGAPPPAPRAPVRLWVDRSFSVRGAGTVVTGTLPAGRLAVGDDLQAPSGERLGVRGLQTLGRTVPAATGVARVAVNLRGVATSALRRGDALTTPGTHRATTEVDVRLAARDAAGGRAGAGAAAAMPEQLVLHLGSAAVAVHVRPLDGAHARLRLRTPLPLRIGDTGLLRDPGAHRVVAGTVVLDPAPPPLHRRGAAAARARVLAQVAAAADAGGELERRGVVESTLLTAIGVDDDDAAAAALRPGVLRDGRWLVSPATAATARDRLVEAVAAAARERPLDPGLPLESARGRSGLPTTALVTALVAAAAPGAPPLAVRDGRVVAAPAATGAPGAAVAASGGPDLPPQVAAAVRAVLSDLARAPYAAPDAARLRELGLGPKELAAAVRSGALVRVGDGVHLAASAVAEAPALLAGLQAPFTSSQARQAWATSRRVALPLLALLDRRGATRRLPDDRRELTGR